jgi:hypothetical protein
VGQVDGTPLVRADSPELTSALVVIVADDEYVHVPFVGGLR